MRVRLPPATLIGRHTGTAGMDELPKDYGVDLYGPTRPDQHWQAQAGEGFDAAHFQIDWEREQATCSAGKTSISWTPAIDNRKNKVIKIKFSTKDCGACPSWTRCIHSIKKYQRRTLTVPPKRRMRPYKPLASGRTRRSSWRRMPNGRASKGRCRGASGSAACAGRVTSAWRAPI
jgi:hypothetical protein